MNKNVRTLERIHGVVVLFRIHICTVLNENELRCGAKKDAIIGIYFGLMAAAVGDEKTQSIFFIY